MSRINVKNNKGDIAPFLRGILTRSLQKVGLTFSEAYMIASEVRDNLSIKENISSQEIRDAVSESLLKKFGRGIEERYRLTRSESIWIRIFGEEEDDIWFSRIILLHRLEICGIPSLTAEDLVHDVHEFLIRNYPGGIARTELHRLAYNMIFKKAGSHFARNFEAWHQLSQSNKILVLLIGGAPGVGKSITATHIASRLNITRTQSTDMLREVLRTLYPINELPQLHYSSFNAWQALGHLGKSMTMKRSISKGYELQSDEVEKAVKALLERAQQEQSSIIIEGVHIRPSIINRIALDSDVIVVPILLAVNRKKTLKSFYNSRSLTAWRRGGQYYLDNFDAIWHLQSELTDQANACNVPVIINDDKETNTSLRIFSLIATAVTDSFPLESESKKD